MDGGGVGGGIETEWGCVDECVRVEGRRRV